MKTFLKKNINSLVAVSVVLLVFIFIGGTGTLNSGFHFVDDHEVIKMKSELKTSSVLEVSGNWIKTDISGNMRFRPLYYFHRVAETKVFGSDFFLWSVYTAILCCIAVIAFFFGIRNLKFGVTDSIVFVLVIFIGPQFSVWWRLGPQESLGMVFLGLAFYFMSNSFGKSSFNANNLLFILFLILSSLTKESFILIIPAMVFFRVWYEKWSLSIGLKEVIKRNTFLFIPLLAALAELIYIKINVGTGYAGIDAGTVVLARKLLYTALYFVKSFFHLFILLLFIVLLGIWFNLKKGKRTDPLPFIFFLLLVAPNIILYSGSGMFERYLLPATLGMGYLVTSALREIEAGNRLIKKAATVLALITFLPFIISSLADALQFSREGHNTNLLLTSVEKQSKVGESVLLVADPVLSYETSVSLKTWLHYVNNTDLYGYPMVNNVDSPEIQGYTDGWNSYFTGRQYSDLQSVPRLLVFLDRSLIERFFIASGVSKELYEQVDVGDSDFALLREKPLN